MKTVFCVYLFFQSIVAMKELLLKNCLSVSLVFQALYLESQWKYVQAGTSIINVTVQKVRYFLLTSTTVYYISSVDC